MEAILIQCTTDGKCLLPIRFYCKPNPAQIKSIKVYFLEKKPWKLHCFLCHFHLTVSIDKGVLDVSGSSYTLSEVQSLKVPPLNHCINSTFQSKELANDGEQINNSNSSPKQQKQGNSHDPENWGNPFLCFIYLVVWYTQQSRISFLAFSKEMYCKVLSDMTCRRSSMTYG